MTYREAVYLVMDLLHLMSDDAGYTEQHIIFLLNKYRIFLLKNNLDKDAATAAGITDSAYQSVNLELERISSINGISCTGSEITTDSYYIWRSTDKVPTLSSVGSVKVYITNSSHKDSDLPDIESIKDDFFETSNSNGSGFRWPLEALFTSMDRLRYIGQNRWTKRFLYCSIGPDGYLYAKSTYEYEDPIYVTIRGIFEDPEEVFGDDDDEDILDKDFPIDESLLPLLIDYIVKLIASAEYRPDDPYNNAADDLARMAQYLRTRMKSDFQRQLDI